MKRHTRKWNTWLVSFARVQLSISTPASSGRSSEWSATRGRLETGRSVRDALVPVFTKPRKTAQNPNQARIQVAQWSCRAQPAHRAPLARRHEQRTGARANCARALLAACFASRPEQCDAFTPRRAHNTGDHPNMTNQNTPTPGASVARIPRAAQADYRIMDELGSGLHEPRGGLTKQSRARARASYTDEHQQQR